MANELVLPLEGTVNFLAGTAYVWTADANLSYHLYKNDLTPDKDTVLGDLVEADFSGYSSVTVTAWNYGSISLDAEDRAFTTGTPDAVFTHSGGATDNDIYGYYVLGNSGELMWVQRYDDAPFAMDGAGRTFT